MLDAHTKAFAAENCWARADSITFLRFGLGFVTALETAGKIL